MIVMKFGGTSVQSAAAMQNVISIVQQSAAREKVVVASACAGVTNKLIELAGYAAQADEPAVQTTLAELAERHRAMCHELLQGTELVEPTLARVDALCAELHTLCEGIVLLRECTERSRAALLSFGERLSTPILAAGFQAVGCSAVLVDARTVMRTSSDYLQAQAQLDDVARYADSGICSHTREGHIVVTQGFIGSDVRGRTTLLGRGGSDLSAAILGAALHADEIQIWTDVSGIYTTDPRIVPQARAVPRMSFAQASELAYFGAKVLHPDTIRPAVDKGIPVRVLNTFQPHDSGTLLTPAVDDASDGIRALALKKECAALALVIKPEQSKKQCMAALYTAAERLEVEILAAEGAERHYSVYVSGVAAAEALSRAMQAYAACSVQPVAVLCICVPRVSAASTSTMADIAHALAPFQPFFWGQLSTNGTVLAAVEEQHGAEALRVLHSLVRNAEKEITSKS